MGDLKSIVQKRLTELIEHTIFSVELCNSFKSRKLVTPSEYQKILKFQEDGQHSEGATYLYTTVVPKLDKDAEKNLTDAFVEGLCTKVVEILRHQPTGELQEEKDVFEGESRFPLRLLILAEVNFLRGFENGKYNLEGKFEGLNLKDEALANEILSRSAVGGSLDWSLTEENCETSKPGEFIHQVKAIVKCLEQKTLWWNQQATRLPANFIERTLIPAATIREVSKISEHFLWLVDSPGMGKSSFTTKLEENWRRETPYRRIVVRINLNQVQNLLQDEESREEDPSLKAFLRRFVPFLPHDLLKSFSDPPIKVFVLLDGLDEVSPQHVDTMLQILHSLLVSPQKSSEKRFLSGVLRRPHLAEPLQLEKLFLTTRPHLKSVIEKEFLVNAHCLLPLQLSEQIQFLSQEVSEVNFSKEKAQRVLKSLPFDTQSLVENPLMLFILAQVIISESISSNLVSNISDLFLRFIEAKHWLHVVEKDAVDPEKPEAQKRVTNMLQANLPHYYAVAQMQLVHSDSDANMPHWGQLPVGSKQVELLSFGLLVNNSSGQPKFVHRTFAEFFFAHLLTSRSTSVSLKDHLFRHMYSTLLCVNTEQFVLCMLNKLPKQFPIERLLPVSMAWLDKFTLDNTDEKKWWPHRELQLVLRRFLEGHLFPLLGEDILSFSVDLENPEVVYIIVESALLEYNSPLLWWLTQRDPQWTRQKLFKLQQTSCATNFLPIASDLVTNLFCEDPHGLARSLSDEEIVSGLLSTRHLVRIVIRHPKWSRSNVENCIGRDELKKAMMTKESLEMTVQSKDAAWWLAEVLTKEDLHSILSKESTRVTDLGWNEPLQVETVWGQVFLPDPLSFKFKFEGGNDRRNIFVGNKLPFLLKKLQTWGRLSECFVHLRKTRLLTRNWWLLIELEKLLDEFPLGSNFVQMVVGGEEEGCVWNDVDSVPQKFLPFIVRYGKLHHLSKLINSTPQLSFLWNSPGESLVTSLLLSLVVDETNDTFDLIISSNKIEELPQAWKNILDIFLSVDNNILRKAVVSTFPNWKIHCPLVRQVSWGGVFLRLIPSISAYVQHDILCEAVNNFIVHPSSRDVNEVLSHLLTSRPSFRQFLLWQVASGFTRRQEDGQQYSKERRLSYLRFLLEWDETKLSWVSFPPSFSFLIKFIVEIRLLTTEELHEIPQVKEVSKALEKVLKRLVSREFKAVSKLLELFPLHKTDRDWETILQVINIIPRKKEFVEGKCVVYENTATALLQVWLRHFGKEKTRKLAEEEVLPYCLGQEKRIVNGRFSEPFAGEEVVLLAVDLGNLRLLKEVAWPSLLAWKSPDGKSFLETAEDQWGWAHEVTLFLQQKSQLTFSCS